MYKVQIRQRIPGAPHYMEWRDLPEPFCNKARAILWASAEIAARSHSLDVRVMDDKGHNHYYHEAV